jgi:hypothetical protein
MTASTFIFVHDQHIVLDYLAAGKFNDLPEVKYVFLGMRPTDQIEHLVDMGKVIIARNLPDNIEHFPNLVAWTGWYALVRNQLITTHFVNLFEYDVNVVGKWEQPMERCAYFGWPSTDETWWNYNGIQYEVEKFAYGFKSSTPMPMTSNYTLDFDEIEMAVNQSVKLNLTYKQAGHVAERLCSWLFSYAPIYPNRLTHLYADSHGTQGRGDRYQEVKSRLL